MKKIVLLLITVFLVTGCAVKYNVVINEDLTVDESAMLTGTDDFFANYYKTTRTNVLKDLLSLYEDYLMENNYQYELKEERVPYVMVNRKYDSVKEYINNSKLFNDYFDEIVYTETGSVKKIETIGYHENESDNPERFDITELEITITCPYTVKKHNAIEVNKSSNTYHFVLNDENTKILFEYDTSSKYNPNADLLKTLIILFALVIGIWLVVIVLTKKNNKNSI